MRFAPEGEDFLDVCPLCHEIAAEHGWVKEGSPTTPTFDEEPRKRKFSLGAFLDPAGGEEEVADRVRRLHRWNHAELRETGDVAGRNHLGVLITPARRRHRPRRFWHCRKLRST